MIAVAETRHSISDCFQAADEVNKGHIKPSDKLYELKALQEQNKKEEVCGSRQILPDL